ncbi:MAG: elongation factor G [Planctomycetota bacterium]|jgi:elongation factor G
MKTEALRNIGILAHIDAGKTTVSERFLYYTGIERRIGEVHDGTTVMDWMPEERERGITITSAVTSCPWRGARIQLIDTPGHVDFTAEVTRSLRVLDGAVIVLDGVAGPQAQSEAVVRLVRQQELPMLLFVNKMDRPGADFTRAVEQSAQLLHPGVLPVQLPFGSGRESKGVIDLIQMRLLTWKEEDQGMEVHAAEIPASHRQQAAAARADLCSRVAEQREEWSDLYLETDDLPQAVLHQALRLGTLERTIVPVLCGAALRNMGIQPLLDAVVDWFPAPSERPEAQGVVAKTGEELAVPPEADDPLAALCFKVTHEKHGELVYLRIFAGTLKPGASLINVRTGQREKIQTVYTMHADHREKVEVSGPGALLAVPGLPRVQTGDTLCDSMRQVLLAPIAFPEPVLRRALEAQDAAEQDKLEHALEILVREDPTLRVAEDVDTGGFLLSGMGELHLEIAVHRLQRAFGLRVRAGAPLVHFRETLKEPVESTAALTIPGEDGAQVEAQIRLEPHESERPTFLLTPSCPDLPQDLVHFLQQPDLLQGWVGHEGYPIAQLRLLLLGWNANSEQPPSQEMLLGAMQLAVSKAFAENSVLLGPRMALEVVVPEEFLSGVLADLQKRHAQIQEVEAVGEARKILAQVSLARMSAYSTDLRSLSQGRAHFQMVPDGLAPHVDG